MKRLEEYSLPAICMVTAALTLPGFLGAMGIGLFVLDGSSSSGYFNLNVVETCSWFFGMVSLVLVVVIFAGWQMVRNKMEGMLLAHITAQTVSIAYTTGNVLLGTHTTPVGLVIIGCVGMGFLLFPRVVISAAIASAAIILGLSELALAAGSMEYAPFFSKPPYENGELVPVARLLFSFIYYSGMIAVGYGFYYLVNMIRQGEKQLHTLAVTDGLTGITNRREFVRRLDNEWIKACRTGRPTSLLFCDIDNFKKVNDSYGHEAGDNVIIAVAEIIDQSVREGTDIAARIGGEEFALLLSETDTLGAQVVANRILEKVRKMRFVAKDLEFKISISIGLACTDDYTHEPSTLIKVADQLLYTAKENGRDQAVIGSV